MCISHATSVLLHTLHATSNVIVCSTNMKGLCQLVVFSLVGAIIVDFESHILGNLLWILHRNLWWVEFVQVLRKHLFDGLFILQLSALKIVVGVVKVDLVVEITQSMD